MIAASEEFLSTMTVCVSDDGSLSRAHMRVAALDAGCRQFLTSPGHAMSCPSALSEYWIESIIVDPGNAEWIRDAALQKIEIGMPFVGWALGSETRRISGPAQPGEGDFIKYLGRDF